MATGEAFYAVAGSKKRKYLRTKVPAYLRSFLWPWVVAFSIGFIWLILATTTGEDWSGCSGCGSGDEHMAPLAVIYEVSGIILGFLGVLFSIVSYGDSKYEYQDRIRNSKAAQKKPEILARVNNAGQVVIYEEQDRITGYSRKTLETFDPEDTEAIYEYVSEQRERLNPDYNDAVAIAKVINGER